MAGTEISDPVRWQDREPSEAAGLVARATMGVLALGAAAVGGWWVYVAFFGGTMPLIGLRTRGGLLLAVLWFVVVLPVAAACLRIFLVGVTGVASLLLRGLGRGAWVASSAAAGIVAVGAVMVVHNQHFASFEVDAHISAPAVSDTTGICAATQGFVNALNRKDSPTAAQALSQMDHAGAAAPTTSLGIATMAFAEVGIHQTTSQASSDFDVVLRLCAGAGHPISGVG